MVTLTYVLVVAVKGGTKEVEVVVSAKTYIEALAKAKRKANDLDFCFLDAYVRRVEYEGI